MATAPSAPTPHVSVLLDEVVALLQPRSAGRYVDGTVGAGGHAAALLDAAAPDGRLLGMDVDPQALRLAAETLQPFGDRVTLVQTNFRDLGRVVTANGFAPADGVLLDLGVSSMQLDQAERGFSFQGEGPLDMRMSPSASRTAADLVNELPEAELANVIYTYGEERHSRRVARAIVRRRQQAPFASTGDLAAVIAAAAPHGTHRGERPIHPATRTFQALRIAVNDELGSLEAALPAAVEALAPEGRLVVISFHSLEDRIVKQFFQRAAGKCVCPSGLPECRCGARASLRPVSKKPIVAGAAEVSMNPRSRSAKLRVAEKLHVPGAS